MSRATNYDLQALAAMPGLEALSEPLVPHLRGLGDRDADAMAMLVFLGFCRVTGSAEAATAEFKSGRWQIAVDAAAKVGRTLSPSWIPTADKYRHMLDNAAAKNVLLGDELATLFTPVMADLVRSAGLLRPDTELDPARPARENTIYGDGSVFRSISDVYVDGDGILQGSRARSSKTARIPVRHHGKRDSSGIGTPGSPITLVGVHGGGKYRRAVLAVGTHQGFAEITSAMHLLHRVIDTYGPGVHAAVYDKLMAPVHMRELVGAGVVPIVDVSNADTSKNTNWLDVPDDRHHTIGRTGQPVTRARYDRLDIVTHTHAGGDCTHDMWALAGSLYATDDGTTPGFADPALEQVSLAWETDHGNRQLIGRYRVPCQHGTFTYDVDFTGTFVSHTGTVTPIMQTLRPISPTDALLELRGRRSDVESVFATFKASTPNGRSTRLELDHFLLDVVGAGLWQNSILWDVHTSRFTRHAKDLHTAEMRRLMRTTCLK